MTPEEAEEIAAAEVVAMEAPEKIARLEEQVAALQRELADARDACAEQAMRLAGARVRAQRAEYIARETLSHFTEKGHPGEARLRTGWIRESTVDEWRAIVADLDARPDDPEEIRRLAESTETET